MEDAAEGAVWVALKHSENEETNKFWPGKQFELVHRVSLLRGGDSLRSDIFIKNTSDKEDLTNVQLCFHTYFAVSSIANVSVQGLKQLSFVDKVHGGTDLVEHSDGLTINEEVDRIYTSAPDTIVLRDGSRTIAITKENMGDIVVWNPWAEKSAGMGDLPNDGYQHFVCIEPVSLSNAHHIAPNHTVHLSQTLALGDSRSML